VPRPSRHLLAPLAFALASLAVPFASSGKAPATVGTAGSVDARAAQLGGGDGRPADQRFPLDGAELQLSREVARAHWNADACGGAVTFAWVTMEATTNATASWRNPTDAWNNVAENFDCKIELNTAAEFDFPKLCTVVAHEVGHLVGQQHAEQAGQLMSPYYSDPLPACVSANPAGPRAAAQPSQEGMEDVGFTLADRTAKAAAAERAAAKRAAAKRKAAKKRTLDRRAKRRCVTRFKASKRGVKRVKRCGKAARGAKRVYKTRRAKR
jgi:Matrixin